jgi:phosphatidylglycerol---prolipoprotein diacylglyceryl transferase
MLPVLQIGPLALQTPGLVLLLGLWLGLMASERFAIRVNFDSNRLYNLVFTGLIGGILGGRVLFALSYPEAFSDSPISLISLNLGLFDLWGGGAVGILAALIYANRSKLPFWRTLDALTPLFAVLGVALSLANLASGSGFGAPSDVPWAVHLWGANRHPSQVYESISAAIIFLLVFIPRTDTWYPAPGARFLSFLALTAGARLFLEAFRGDSQLMDNGIRTAQVIAWLVLALALFALKKRHTNENLKRITES